MFEGTGHGDRVRERNSSCGLRTHTCSGYDECGDANHGTPRDTWGPEKDHYTHRAVVRDSARGPESKVVLCTG